MKTITLTLIYLLLLGCRSTSQKPLNDLAAESAQPEILTPYGVTETELETIVQSHREYVKARGSDTRVDPNTTEEMKILQKYNMDIMRARGKMGPPLPIPITEEMDDQLVQEGVIPPKKKTVQPPSRKKELTKPEKERD
jgi:hypothetical protein